MHVRLSKLETEELVSMSVPYTSVEVPYGACKFRDGGSLITSDEVHKFTDTKGIVHEVYTREDAIKILWSMFYKRLSKRYGQEFEIMDFVRDRTITETDNKYVYVFIPPEKA